MSPTQALAPMGVALPPAARAIIIPVVLFGMYAAFGAAWMAVVPLFPEIEGALGVDRARAAWLVTIVSLAKSFVPVVVGVVAARVGLTRTLRAAALLIAVAVVIPWLSSYGAWIATRFVFGVGGAIWLTLMGAVVVDVIAPARRGFVNALNGVAVNTGAILGLRLALPLKDALGHRVALTVLAAGTVLFGALLFLAGPLDATDRASSSKVPLADIGRSYLRVLREKTTWIIAAAFSGPLALYLVVNTWLPSHLQAMFDLTRAQAAGWLSTMNLWGIPASLAVGVMLQRNIGAVRTHVLAGALVVPLGMLGALTANEDLRGLFFAVAGVGMFLPVAPLVTLLQRQPGMTAPKFGMVMGTMGSVTYIVSSVAPNVVGDAVAAGATLDGVLVPCCLLGLTPVIALSLPEPTSSS